ncbi:N-acetylglucosamine-6-phosphate deacetylase [Histoplasma capsulatum var. duboisii H88]|uniref:N-acetylglucosamine-6-phosphate deacetylase n=3 Tax=Ajellomyces capsulatus TaxID=5037 RepID=C0P031_AJECG|nr:N-acetylglucosamine-6-phosphate deacetylase [Histoplasma capsulatum G186AR]EGC48474.1 N-acetylglucosamine-6-phosphate deacetylase [Histoplasma capsulatum var. duboisii H88]KAG5296244.1 N-acetylglucosamine-6-phosphate deacetylase [Histoplasma capsulatum]EEH03121.1 N-acetylglucosamine-6-phosphate deacetylase [Histoplasma capsulatum G186AR]QSS50495.1 N-acetylglucosamine-6-phosphate deacetylase [Histoplasma capsulatum var. duboisii H88]QSS74226.1 N-acetylglucosamine-6-phosphate deacetylase [His
MPSIAQHPDTPVPTPRITKFTNCRLPLNGHLVEQDLWVDSATGKILQDQQAFYEFQLCPDQTVDLGGRILAPGFIDVQLNGARGFDFSVPQPTKEEYDAGFRKVNLALVRTGVTSYLPTVTSQESWVYKKVLPSLGPSGGPRRAEDGAESLGAHVEGPFLSPGKNGIHSPSVLLAANTGFQDLIDCYGAENLLASQDVPSSAPITPTTTSTSASSSASSASTTRSNPTANIKMITAAPEVGIMNTLIPTLVSHNIIYSIGHSDATYEQALDALAAGATMITHLFNAMRPFYHRHPGIFGLLAQQSQQATRPFYGLIADGIHLHPTSVQIAYHAHPAGMVLVTDAMKLCGMPDGVYEWTNGERIIKRGALLTLEGSAEGKIAGSSATLIECVNNFRRWAGTGVVEAVRAVTETPARMLGLEGVKGVLVPGADADLVVLGEDAEGTLTVDQVWKFGVRVFDCVKDAQWEA